MALRWWQLSPEALFVHCLPVLFFFLIFLNTIFRKALREFLQIWHKCPHVFKDELIRCWCWAWKLVCWSWCENWFHSSVLNDEERYDMILFFLKKPDKRWHDFLTFGPILCCWRPRRLALVRFGVENVCEASTFAFCRLPTSDFYLPSVRTQHVQEISVLFPFGFFSVCLDKSMLDQTAE